VRIEVEGGTLRLSVYDLMEQMGDEALQEFLRSAVFSEKLFDAAVQVLALGSAFDDEVAGLGSWFPPQTVEQWASKLDAQMPEVIARRISNLRFIARCAENRAHDYYDEAFKARAAQSEWRRMKESRDLYAEALHLAADKLGVTGLDLIAEVGVARQPTTEGSDEA